MAISHDSVMLEACNTSFQMHLQIKPEEFESKYNWAQAISGPVLAASVNSPLLLGKELWSETRIALFQQSMDTRKLTRANIDQQARVSFGENWVRGSIVDHYKSELSRFPILLTKKIEESSYQSLMDGKIPQLKALNLHNGTVYRWNRPCYGVGNGKAHIRIENRYIPSGPSVEDEIANMAFWVGLMHGQSEDEIDIWKKMDFSDAKNNFIRAAKEGSEAVMNWMGKKSLVSDLISNELLPKAKKGLEKLNVNSQEIAYYLGVVKQRLEVHTGSQWTIKNYRALKKNSSQDHALLTLTKGIYENQRSGKSVAEWPDIQSDQHPKNQATKMGHIMSTTLITANQADSARLTVELMRWNNIHHLPVVDDQRNLVGLITWRHLDKYWEQIRLSENLLCVEDIMVKKVVTVETTTPIAVAYKRAKRLKIGCLPVLQNSKLVGIITKRDLNKINDAPDLQ